MSDREIESLENDLKVLTRRLYEVNTTSPAARRPAGVGGEEDWNANAAFQKESWKKRAPLPLNATDEHQGIGTKSLMENLQVEGVHQVRILLETHLNY